jgi:hypothetical protein
VFNNGEMEEGRVPQIVIAVLALLAAGSLIYFFAVQDSPEKALPLPDTPSESEIITPETPINQDIALKVFFHKSTDDNCSHVYSVSRQVPTTPRVGTAALNQLFAGPTPAEQLAGYTSVFSSQTADILNSIQVKNGIVHVDLKDIRTLLPSVSASCGSEQFLAEVTNTLKQFSTVQRVVLAIEKDVEGFYQWMHRSCDDSNAFCDNTVFKKDLVTITTPSSNSQIDSPVTVAGEARGSWFFEASFPVKILNDQGSEMGRGIAQTKSNWMTTERIPFTASIPFQPGPAKSGVIILEKDNPSGLPENADSVRAFITF